MASRLTRRQWAGRLVRSGAGLSVAIVAAGRSAWAAEAAAAVVAATASDIADDPFGSLQWPDLQREFFGLAPVEFDGRVQVQAPAFAEDPLNVPLSVAVRGLQDVLQVTVLVDRNPIRRVLDYFPVAAVPGIALRFKLEQASPVRAAARTADGRWHLGGTWVDSAGGGCTLPAGSRQDGSWSRHLGEVSARLFDSSPDPAAVARLRLRVMHPMDTGLAPGIPAFHLSRLSLRDAHGRELLRLQTYEPVSENPVFSFDFAQRPQGPLRLVGSDNNGNRIDRRIEAGPA